MRGIDECCSSKYTPLMASTARLALFWNNEHSAGNAGASARGMPGRYRTRCARGGALREQNTLSTWESFRGAEHVEHVGEL